MQLAREMVDSLLERYGIHTPVTDERFSSHAELERGTRLEILCREDPEAGKQIAVACGGFTAQRPCPLEPDAASGIVEQLHERRLIPKAAQERRTLEHLLLRCSELYLSEDLESLHLAPVYLRENDYRVGSASMEHTGAVHTKEQLDPGAHDKGAVFAYRPTARGRHAPTDHNQT